MKKLKKYCNGCKDLNTGKAKGTKSNGVICYCHHGATENPHRFGAVATVRNFWRYGELAERPEWCPIDAAKARRSA